MSSAFGYQEFLSTTCPELRKKLENQYRQVAALYAAKEMSCVLKFSDVKDASLKIKGSAVPYLDLGMGKDEILKGTQILVLNAFQLFLSAQLFD